MLGTFEKYLTFWVLACIAIGIGVGYTFENSMHHLSEWNISTVNVPVAILVWLMIYPMMLQVDFSSIKKIGNRPRGIVWTLIINWAVKPFTMAFFAWLFFDKIFSAYLSQELASEYIAGAILLGAAACTAMVFVWNKWEMR